MLAIVNTSAGAGKAASRWERVEPTLRELVGPFTVAMPTEPSAVRKIVTDALDRGETKFIAAGGDGTVNLLMSTIMEHATSAALPTIKLGAVGIGSSNDFHKPRSKTGQIGGVPIKLDFGSTVRHDVCLTTYTDGVDEQRQRRWLINASIGTTAEANRYFNGDDRGLEIMKRISPWRGLVYAALRTVLGYRARDMRLTFEDGATVRARVKNLGIVKNPHFTGALCYDSPYEPDSGDFFVHLLRDIPWPRLALMLLRLLRGRFSGQDGAETWRSRRVRVEADQPFAVEGDGEVITTRDAYFSVLPRVLQVCT